MPRKTECFGVIGGWKRRNFAKLKIFRKMHNTIRVFSSTLSVLGRCHFLSLNLKSKKNYKIGVSMGTREN